MIDTIELSALMRQGTGMDEATADRIAQAILKAHEMSPPVSRDYLDARLDATREYLDGRLDALDGRLNATRDYLDGQLKATREYLDGRLEALTERVEKRLAQQEAKFEKSLRLVAWSLWGSGLATLSLTLGGVYFLLTHFKP